MQQAKFSCKENQVEFLNNYKEYGFKDKSSLVREALNRLKKELESQQLKESADLYTETYMENSDLKALTESAAQVWPE
ncbi:MAG: hypothetical protein KKD92_02110 [Proteobacteria bacterium]|nr:hypothetical protein [Pseudomonadota bacterium]